MTCHASKEELHFCKIELVSSFGDAIVMLKYFNIYKARLGPNLSSTVSWPCIVPKTQYQFASHPLNTLCSDSCGFPLLSRDCIFFLALRRAFSFLLARRALSTFLGTKENLFFLLSFAKLKSFLSLSVVEQLWQQQDSLFALLFPILPDSRRVVLVAACCPSGSLGIC